MSGDNPWMGAAPIADALLWNSPQELAEMVIRDISAEHAASAEGDAP